MPDARLNNATSPNPSFVRRGAIPLAKGDHRGFRLFRRFGSGAALCYRSILVIAACAATLLCASCGPRMNIQRSIHPYERAMPEKPAGMTPTTGRLVTLTSQQAKLAVNPLPANKTNLANGKIYYGYYCLMCHGEKGDGNGPVGQGYVPKPTDLSTLTGLTDGQLYNKMLTGKGHDPVMSQTVQPDHRWALVMYVRGFSHKGVE